mmetsp:Transcript_74946/g.229327  ORF Transcript_74946/g.229327 Transcript_74946/m.229327 type:complete len:209 (-) Transcript_74946:200-826(-)
MSEGSPSMTTMQPRWKSRCFFCGGAASSSSFSAGFEDPPAAWASPVSRSRFFPRFGQYGSRHFLMLMPSSVPSAKTAKKHLASPKSACGPYLKPTTGAVILARKFGWKVARWNRRKESSGPNMALSCAFCCRRRMWASISSLSEKHLPAIEMELDASGTPAALGGASPPAAFPAAASAASAVSAASAASTAAPTRPGTRWRMPLSRPT